MENLLQKKKTKKRIWKNQGYEKPVDLSFFLSYVVGVYQHDVKIFVLWLPAWEMVWGGQMQSTFPRVTAAIKILCLT